jgi:hypothetical protein
MFGRGGEEGARGCTGGDGRRMPASARCVTEDEVEVEVEMKVEVGVEADLISTSVFFCGICRGYRKSVTME